MFAALSLSVLLFACSKSDKATDDRPAPGGEKAPIKVSVQDFVKKVEQLPSPIGRKSSASARDSVLATKISDIYYFVFDPYQVLISFKHQHSTDEDFGIIADSLIAGNYRISIVGATDSLNVNGRTISNISEELQLVTPYPDMFYGGANITVSTGSPNTYDMSLSRYVALLEVNILDAPAISADSSVTVKLGYENTHFDMYYGASGPGAMNYPMGIPRRAQHIFNSFVLNTGSEVSVEISYPDRTTNAVLTKTIRHLQLNRNSKTVLTGNLYTTPPPPAKHYNGFSVSVNDIWGPTDIINF